MPDFLPWMFDGVGTAVAGYAAARVRRRQLSRAVSRRARTTVFTAGSGPYMTDFYACLAAKISSARHCVYITGEGFEPSSDGDSLACVLVAAMRDALSRGVPIVRLQTSAVVSDLWHSQLRGLMADFPYLFELCVPLDQAQPQLASMCAIDVDDMSRNVAEMMVGLPRFLGTRTCKVAVTAIFAEGHQMLAQAIRDQIIGCCADPAASRRLRTAAATDAYFRGKYYFAYGSNMAPAQMTARCPSALKVCVAVLAGHRLVFNRSGSYRPGGVANLEPSPGERVYGVLWKLSRAEFQALDQAEDPRAYGREQVQVRSEDGQPYDCDAYMAIPDQPDIPDCNYLEALIQAGHDAGLPPEYLTRLHARRPDPPPIPHQASGPDRHPDPSPQPS
jgi:cation transport regulator ChaC